MTKSLLREGVLWGVLLWLFGYLLGFALYAVVPMHLLGWVVMPFALALTIWVALQRVHGATLGHYLAVGAIWAVIAIVLDYFLLVQLLHPADGYYMLDVYLYYALCFLVPAVAGWWKTGRANEPLG